MSRVANKTARLQEIELLLITHPEGLNQTEIAERLGVDRSTISRNLRDLQAPIYSENGRLYLDRRGYLLNLKFTMHEALSLHLAARLLASNIDRQNAHAASALRKISQAMEKLAPHLSRHIFNSAEAIDELAGYDHPTYMRVLETLTEGWATGCKVKIGYRKSSKEPITRSVFSPYYIEPSAWGRSTYVIGLREPHDEMRTFKIERIEQAELLKEHYSVPVDFDPYRLLANAWGIWYSEEAPVEVVLKFRPRVAGRVQETRWHRSQQVETCPDGGLILRMRVAATQEMVPWIRMWGADVQVIEPAELRESLSKELRLAAENYGWVIKEDTL